MSELPSITQRYEAFPEGYRTSGDMEVMIAQSLITFTLNVAVCLTEPE